MSDALSDDGSDINQDESQEDVMTPAELIAKLEEVSSFQRKYHISHLEQLAVARQHVMALISPSVGVLTVVCPCVSLAGLAEREVLPGAAGEQVWGGGVRDGAADSHGKLSGEYLLLYGLHV